jgi:hypothetical protein
MLELFHVKKKATRNNEQPINNEHSIPKLWSPDTMFQLKKKNQDCGEVMISSLKYKI